MTTDNTSHSPRTSARRSVGDAGACAHRHIGPSKGDCEAMLEVLCIASLDAMVNSTVPETIRMASPLKLDAARSE